MHVLESLTMEAQLFKVSSGLGGLAEKDLPAFVQDSNAIKELEDN